MAFEQLITPNLGYRAQAGLCLVMAQGITGAPVQNPSATAAANRTKFRHASRTMPNTVAVLWFDHYGTYGDPPERKNWGHVVVYVPGRGFASSSPVYGEYSAPYWYSSIDAVERAFNCSFRFWTEDINGRRVCRPAPEPSKPVVKPTPAPKPLPEEEIMASAITYVQDKATKGQGTIYAVIHALSKKRPIKSPTWNMVREAEKVAANAGRPEPVDVLQITKAELDAIPDA